MKHDPKPTPPPTADELAAAIQERINRAETRRTVLRAEVDDPPEKVSAYYFTDRLDEIRTLTLMVDAIRDLLKP